MAPRANSVRLIDGGQKNESVRRRDRGGAAAPRPAPPCQPDAGFARDRGPRGWVAERFKAPVLKTAPRRPGASLLLPIRPVFCGFPRSRRPVYPWSSRLVPFSWVANWVATTWPGLMPGFWEQDLAVFDLVDPDQVLDHCRAVAVFVQIGLRLQVKVLLVGLDWRQASPGLGPVCVSQRRPSG